MKTYYHISRDLIPCFADICLGDFLGSIDNIEKRSLRLLVVSNLCQFTLYDLEVHFRIDEVTIEYKCPDSSFFASLPYSTFVSLLKDKHIKYMSTDFFLTY